MKKNERDNFFCNIQGGRGTVIGGQGNPGHGFKGVHIGSGRA